MLKAPINADSSVFRTPEDASPVIRIPSFSSNVLMANCVMGGGHPPGSRSRLITKALDAVDLRVVTACAKPLSAYEGRKLLIISMVSFPTFCMVLIPASGCNAIIWSVQAAKTAPANAIAAAIADRS